MYGHTHTHTHKHTHTRARESPPTHTCKQENVALQTSIALKKWHNELVHHKEPRSDQRICERCVHIISDLVCVEPKKMWIYYHAWQKTKTVNPHSHKHVCVCVRTYTGTPSFPGWTRSADQWPVFSLHLTQCQDHRPSCFSFSFLSSQCRCLTTLSTAQGCDRGQTAAA